MHLFNSFLAESHAHGAFVGVRFAPQIVKAIKEFQTNNHIQNPTPVNELHTTLIYSPGKNVSKGYKEVGKYDKPLLGSALNFDLWGDDKRILVLLFNSPSLKARRDKLMKAFEFTTTYPVYQPHLTLSYDVGDEFGQKELHQLNVPDNLGTIVIVSEYYEPLSEEWK